MKKAVVVFSGGQDSTTCLGWAKNRYDEVYAITFRYGQRHDVEVRQAGIIAQYMGIKNWEVLPVNAMPTVAESELYSGKESDIGGVHKLYNKLPASFVPNRNAVFLTLAHAYAQMVGAEDVITGVCQTDYSGYPDCRSEFVIALQTALNLSVPANVWFQTPLMYLTKAETFHLAREEGVINVVLKLSHTCYNNDHRTWNAWGYGCGKCPACELRAKGWDEYLKTL